MAKAKTPTSPTRKVAKPTGATAPAMGGPAPEVGSSAAAPAVPPAAQKTPRAAKPKATASQLQQAQQPQIVITATHDQIAKRAYEIWLAKGRPVGQDHQNWREAEAEVSSTSGR